MPVETEALSARIRVLLSAANPTVTLPQGLLLSLIDIVPLSPRSAD